MNNLKKEAYKIRMTPDEKAAMKAQIFGVPSPHTPRPSPYFIFNFQFITKAVALCLVVILVGGGGVAYAAQGSLPGNPLYAVKVDVTEPIQTALAVTPEAQADVHVELAQRRVEEAEALAVQGRLDATTTQQLEQNFNDQTASANDLAVEVGQSDPAAAVEIEAKIASSLSVHGVILATLGAQQGDGTATDSSAFAARVLARAQAAVASSSSEAATGARVAVANASAVTPSARTFATVVPQAAPGSAASTTQASTTAVDVSTSAVVSATSTAIAPAQTEEPQTGSQENSELQSRAQQALDDAQSAYSAAKPSLDASTTQALDAQFGDVSQLMQSGEYTRALTLALRLQAIIAVAQNYQADIAPLLNLPLNLGHDRGSGR